MISITPVVMLSGTITCKHPKMSGSTKTMVISVHCSCLPPICQDHCCHPPIACLLHHLALFTTNRSFVSAIPMISSSLFTLSIHTMNFYSVTKVITDLPELSAALNYDGLITYIDLVCLLKPDLTHFVVSKNGPPKNLPTAFHDF